MAWGNPTGPASQTPIRFDHEPGKVRSGASIRGVPGRRQRVDQAEGYGSDEHIRHNRMEPMYNVCQDEDMSHPVFLAP